MKVKRLLFSIVLSTALALVAVPQTLEVKAATTTAAEVKAVERKRIGNTSVYWEIKEDGTLIVSGKGDPKIKVKKDLPWFCFDFEKNIPWYKYRTRIKSVTIEKGVTPKSVRAWFYGCTSLKKVPKIPKGVEDCSWMFGNCASLKEAPIIPEGVKECDGMFYGCDSLVEAPTIPKGVKSCAWMFQECTSLKEAPAIAKGVTNCDGMFWDCTALKKVPTIPEGVKDCNGMFDGCTALKKAPVIPEGVKDCGGVFYNCTSLTGEVLINDEPATYKGIFKGTKLPISLVYGGDCTKEFAEKIASKYSNVSVKPSETTSETPGQVKNVKVTQKKKGVKPTVTFSKVSSVKGYQIQYSSSSKFSEPTSTYTTNTKATLSNAAKGKKYFVRVRALKLDSNKKKLYGKWSDVKSITVK